MARRADSAEPGGRASGRTAADVLTFLIADVRGYTSFTSEHGDEAAARLARTFAALARESVEARSGSVIELRGDEVLAVFGSARQAIRAAIELQQAIDEEGRDGGSPILPIGIGLDAGEAVPVERGYRGEALNLAARLCALAGPGEVMASDGVVHLARSIQDIAYEELGPVTLKGLGRPVSAVRVSAIRGVGESGAPLSGERPGQPESGPVGTASSLEGLAAPDSDAGEIVGREREMWWLRGSWRLARRGQGRVLFVTGPNGSGKTRLATELIQVATAHGARMFYLGFGGGEQDVAGVVTALASSSQPSLVVMDDLDLAPDGALAGLERLAELAAAGPILVLATYDDRSASARLTATASRLDANGDSRRELQPLDAEQVSAIAALYVGGDNRRMPVTSIREASGGRPGLIHELASEWATDDASRRLGKTAGRTASGRRELHAMEAELASNIVDLQLVRERSRRARAVGEARGPLRGQEICPFKGLAPFQSEDAEFYFGRERLIAELVARLVGASFLALVGPSGSGKSSAVRAGLLPALAAGVLPGSAAWPQIVMRPGDRPLAALERALTGVSPAASFEAMTSSLRPGERLVLAIDQFEEVFTQASHAERDTFIDVITTAARDPERGVIVVLAIRADFYGRCAAHVGLAELMGSSHVLVGPMRADEFARAIELPAEAAGLRIEPELTAALVADVLDEPGGLPLLSTALLELWQRRDGRTLRLAAYQETGGVRGAVARLAEEAYSRLEPDQQSIARGILLRLAAPEEGDVAVRRRAPLVEFDAVESGDVARVLSVLADSRLVTISEGTVEVAHEALLREWPRLANWLEDDAEGRRLRRHLIDAAKEWSGSGRDPAELYRGARLASALDWTTEHTLELNELERAFVNDSRVASEREAEGTRRTNRRLRVLLAGAVGFLAIAVVAGVFAFLQQGEAERAARTAQEQRAEAERSALRADAQRLGAQALTEEDLGLSLLLARQAVALDDSQETRGTLLAALLRAPGAIGVLHGTGDRTNWIDISPDGKVVVAGDHLGALVFFDAQRLEQLGELRIGAGFGHAFSPDGGTLAVNGDDGGPVLMLVDVATRTVRARHAVSAQRRPLDLVAYSRDGSMLGNIQNVLDEEGAETGARVLAILNPETAAPTGREIALRPKPDTPGTGPEDDSCSLAGFGNKEWLFSTCAGKVDTRGRTDLIDPAGATVTRSFPLGGLVAAAPDDSLLAVSIFDGTGSVIFLDVTSGEEHPAAGGHDAQIQGIGYAPDGETVVTVGDDRDVLVWDVASRAVRERLHGHGGRIFGPTFTPDGRTVFTASLDGTVIAWDLGGDRRLGRAFSVGDGVFPDGVHTVALSPDAKTLAVGLVDGTVRLVDLAGAREPRDIPIWDQAGWQGWLDRETDREPFDSEGPWVSGLAFSPDGTTLAVGTNVPPVNLIDVDSGNVTHFESGHDLGWVNSVTWSNDGSSLVTAGDDGTVRMWDPETHVQTDVVQINALEGGRYERPFLTFATLTEDRSTLAVTQSDGVVSLWDVADHRELHRMQADIDLTSTVRFSPDDRHIVTTGFQSGDIVVWDVETGNRVGQPLDAHAGFALDAVFASAGSILVSSGSDGIARLWDFQSGRPYGTPLQSTAQGSHGWIGTAVSGDGNTLVQVNLGGDGNAVTWALDPMVWAERACIIAGRNLSESEWAEFLPARHYDPACTAQTPLAREVRLVLTVEVPPTTDAAGTAVHIAGTLDRVDGNFPKWDPGFVPLTRLDATHWRIELTGAESTRLDYVFTLGSWATKEADEACADIKDREVILDYGQSGTQELTVAVANWGDVAPCAD